MVSPLYKGLRVESNVNIGHVFAGATLPYGMAKAVADTDGDDNQGGFTSGDSSLSVTGFSSMHDSVR
jgi:putative alpha-1,2-mannosidase